MAKTLFWLSDEAWKALSPHLPRGIDNGAGHSHSSGDHGQILV